MDPIYLELAKKWRSMKTIYLVSFTLIKQEDTRSQWFLYFCGEIIAQGILKSGRLKAYIMSAHLQNASKENEGFFGVCEWRTSNSKRQDTSRASLVAQLVKNSPAMRETWDRSLAWEGPLEEGMATHSSILAWEIPWREEPGGLQSMRL